MWDRRHGHVITTCFLAGHPTSSAGKPEHQLQFLRLFAPLALTQGDHWALTAHRTMCALRVGWALAGPWFDGRHGLRTAVWVESAKRRNVAIFFSARRRPGTTAPNVYNPRKSPNSLVSQRDRVWSLTGAIKIFHWKHEPRNIFPQVS